MCGTEKECLQTLADELGGGSHLQRRLIEESDELSREDNNHLLSQELCTHRQSKRAFESDRDETLLQDVGFVFKKRECMRKIDFLINRGG